MAVAYSLDLVKGGDVVGALFVVVLCAVPMWWAVWRPKVQIGSEALRVVNFVRSYDVPLRDIVGPTFSRPEVGFELRDGSDVAVSAVAYGYFVKQLRPQRRTRGDRLVEAVLAARDRDGPGSIARSRPRVRRPSR